MSVIIYMKKFFAWVNRNTTSICTGWIVALIMGAIMLVQDMGHASKEIDHLIDKIELTKENNELAQASISQFEMINNLLKTGSRQRDQVEQSVETINQQTAILQKLVDYLKKIGHWPPKIDPPETVNPDKWI